MSKINPAMLKQLRARKGWTLDELAEKSRVNRQTIHRIETGKQIANRRTTVERLAKALQTDADVLAGDSVDASSGFEAARKSQMNVRISDDARNALALVAMRYQVKTTSIIHLAPLLFLWAAEESLKRRQQQLEQLAIQYRAVESFEGFTHLNGLLTCNWRGDEVMEAERRSIAKRDIFGRTIPDEQIREGYEESEHNPMAVFLSNLVAGLGGLADFEHWSPHWDQPGYTLGFEEASALVGGDEDAIRHIIHGNVGLHEIPREAREAGAERVADWVRQRGEAYWAEISEALDGLIQ